MKYLITAGPTREGIDPVRYLTNRSSGRMGFAIASAAHEAGHDVTLISGPVSLPPIDGVKMIKVVSAEDMYQAVAANIDEAEIVIMTAAVADYRPVHVSKEKIKKGEGHMKTLELERTKDILGSVRDVMHFDGVLVGFAAETEHIRENALRKLTKKRCDVLFANDVSRSDIGFDCKENEMTVYFANGDERSLSRALKVQHGKVIVDICMEVAAQKRQNAESVETETADA